MHCADTERTLDLYLDGELERGSRSDVESHLSVCRNCEARVRGEGLLRAHLAALAADERAPQEVRRSVAMRVWSSAFPRGRLAVAPARRFALRYALSLAAVSAGVVLLWRLDPGATVQEGWAAGLAEDHARMHGSSGMEGLVGHRDPAELTRWFTRRLGVAPTLPEVPDDGRLIGGKVCHVNGRRVAHAVYELDGSRVSYYLVPHVSLPARLEGGRVGHVSYLAWGSPPGSVFILGAASSLKLDRLRER